MKLRPMVVLGLVAVGAAFIAYAQDESISAKNTGPAIGLEVGKRAPAFVAHDQFDHEQTNETLKGRNGTVLLFFRSADW